MKTIKENGLNKLSGYDELKKGEQFIYVVGSIEFFAIKVSDEYAVFINNDGRFICAKAFKNCLSIGSGYLVEYQTFKEAVTACNNDIVEAEESAYYGKSYARHKMTVTDYAKKHNVDASTVRHKIKRGLIPAIKIGKMWLIDEDEPWVDNRYKNRESK